MNATDYMFIFWGLCLMCQGGITVYQGMRGTERSSANMKIEPQTPTAQAVWVGGAAAAPTSSNYTIAAQSAGALVFKSGGAELLTVRHDGEILHDGRPATDDEIRAALRAVALR